MIDLIGLCGESSSGKSKILSDLMKKYPDIFHKKVSYTTRRERSGEINGVDYNFVSRNKFFDLVLKEEILEATDFNGNVYGTGINSFKEDKINLGIFDTEGIETISQLPEINLIPIYLEVEPRIRLIRSLEREENKTIEEIYERYRYDVREFDGFLELPGLLTIKNNTPEEREIAIKIIRTIAEGLLSEKI